MYTAWSSAPLDFSILLLIYGPQLTYEIVSYLYPSFRPTDLLRTG